MRVTDVRDDSEIQRRDDERELGTLGYAQELFRTIGGFSNFALSFSIISILTGAVTLYQHGLVMGGPAEMAFGWPLVALFTMTVALSMAELASAVPTSGAMYHWACRLGGNGWGWVTAWFNIAGQLAAIAGIDYGAALFVTPVVGLPMTTTNILTMYAGILLSHAAIKHIRAVLTARDASGHDVPTVIAILDNALGGRAGTLATALAAMAMWFCGLSAVTWSSRTIYAFARDGGLPWSALWKHVSRG